MKKQSMFIMLLFAFLILSACGAGENQEDNNAGEETESETNSKNEETDTADETKQEETILTDLGIYIGQVDPHTIEIETTEGPKSFQLTDETKTQIEDYQKKDEIQFTYTINKENQNILHSIQKMHSANDKEDEGDKGDKITETGIYNGQADPHTIEIETDDGPTAFQLSMEAREDVEQLTEGQRVTYTYHENGDSRVIESISESE